MNSKYNQILTCSIIAVICLLSGCSSDTLEGCTCAASSNYDVDAEMDDGSCLGCTMEGNENYNACASIDDDTCVEIPGCTDPTSGNYNAIANSDNGTCGDYSIGDEDLGGIVFYILQTGDFGYESGQQHGLVVSAINHGDAPWGCSGTTIDAKGVFTTDGIQNTVDILAVCQTGNIAASICGELVENGYDDWYLPSIGELHKLREFSFSQYAPEFITTGSTLVPFWSSTESNDAFAIGSGFRDVENTEVNIEKQNSIGVTPIRFF